MTQEQQKQVEMALKLAFVKLVQCYIAGKCGPNGGVL